jgi:hypothetical protein
MNNNERMKSHVLHWDTIFIVDFSTVASPLLVLSFDTEMMLICSNHQGGNHILIYTFSLVLRSW